MKKKASTSEKTSDVVKTDNKIALLDTGIADEISLFKSIAAIIENRKNRIEGHVNTELTWMYWEIGKFINSVLLDGDRGAYGKQILPTVSVKLAEQYGRGFKISNIYRMIKFADLFKDAEILATLSPKLSWSHIVELLPLKSQDALLFYAKDVIERKPNEEAPIGIILCATANRKTVEMLEMDKAGIAVAEYWTTLPSKEVFEEKIRSILAEAQERLERRKKLPLDHSPKQIDYFYEPNDDE
jgi:hypothetical protein